MKKFAKRSLSMLLVLMMLVSLLSGIFPSASAATYVSNWGKRGTLATELSNYAIQFYQKAGVSYDLLSALPGGSTTNAVPSSQLYTRLQSVMTSAHTYETDYDETKDLYMYTDCQENNTAKLTCIYCGAEYDAAWPSGGDPWNREHTWPKSKSLDGNDPNVDAVDEEDIMLLRPACQGENSARSNKAYGNTTTGELFYPNLNANYDVRGDLARTMLYVYVRYGNSTYMWGADGVIESLDVLITWMTEDPVDTWEMGRNDAVQSITGTRNVFIDYPELGFLLFNREVPEGYSTPSGAGVSYTVTSCANNSSYGTVTQTGNAITAVPAEGYSVQDYQLLSGSATVTREGNVFYVAPQSDCTVQINFVKLDTYRVTFMENGVSTGSGQVYEGDSVTLPANQRTPGEGYTFVGWVTEAVKDAQQAPTIYGANSSYMVTGDQTFYALYTYREGSGGTAYKLTDFANIQSTDTVVITVDYQGTVYAMTNNNGTSQAPAAVIVSAADGVLTEEPASTLLWNISGPVSGFTIYPAGTTAKWLYSTNGNNGMRVGTNTNKTFTIDSNSGYLKHIGTSRYVGVYTTTPDWRAYTTTTSNNKNQTLGFYVKSEAASVVYTTAYGTAVAAVCENGQPVETYLTVQDAYAAATDGQYIRLLADTQVNLALTKDLYIDLNGCVLEGVINPGAYKVFGMDCTTNAYGATDGYMDCTTAGGASVTVQRSFTADATMTGEIYSYLAIEDDNGWSFHRYYLGLTHTSLKPATVGVGYKAMFCGSETVLAQLDSQQAFGYTLSLEGGNTVTRWLSAEKITSGKAITLRLNNYDAENFGQAGLTAYVSIRLGGEVIESAHQTITLRQLVESVNDHYTTFNADQLAAMKEMILASAAMQTWNVANLLAEAPEAPEVDQTMVQIVNDA